MGLRIEVVPLLCRQLFHPFHLFERRYDEAPIREFVGVALFEKLGGTSFRQLKSVASITGDKLLGELDDRQSR